MLANLIKIGQVGDVAPGSSRVFSVDGSDVVVFNLDGRLYAIDNACPHRGAELGAGTLDGTVVICPRHAWRFDLTTGDCVGTAGVRVRRYDVTVEGDDLLLDTPHDETDATPDGIFRYLIRYGAMGWVGHFGSIERVDCAFRDRVVVQTDRGLELGDVLAAPGDGRSEDSDPGRRQQPTGECLRRMTPDDERHERGLRTQPPPDIEHCQNLLAERRVPVQLIDCERLFDGEAIVFYYLGESAMELGAVAHDLSGDGPARYLFQPALETPTQPVGPGCGKPGCGGGGCGMPAPAEIVEDH